MPSLCSSRLGAALLVLGLSACSRTSAASTIQSSLPAQPGQAWEDAHAALAKLDPAVRDAAGVGGRSATAKAAVSVAGHPFQEVQIVGVADRATVRSVTLSGAPPAGDCEKVRGDLLQALGPDWSVGEPRLGAVTATKDGHMVRVVCTGVELSLSFIG